ncbi:MAG: DNA-protecting protein DprA [Proteobacteria bacterium]|nr:DNA-protecting protein DprA [Pseudomonadota bacterium]
MVLSTDQIARLRLIRTPQVGPVLYRQLLAKYGNAQKALAALPELSRGRKVPLKAPSTESVERELQTLQKIGARFVFDDDDDYPALLHQISDTPPVLTALGNPALLNRKQIALVGTRGASAAGQRFTTELARALGDAGWCVSSGMARGIDTAAHTGALDTPGGTIAVLGGGIDHIYPPENAPLYHQLAQKGCLLTEYAPGAPANASHFPRRNRLIAGMSHAVVVLECDRHSGTLITAQYAGEYGREVMAVPGHPSDPRAKGPNHMIKQGALLVESAEDILSHLDALPDLLAYAPTPRQIRLYTREEDEQSLLFDDPTPATSGDFETLLGTTPVEMDTLIRQSGLSEAEVASRLTVLELDGKLERLPGNRVRLLA